MNTITFSKSFQEFCRDNKQVSVCRLINSYLTNKHPSFRLMFTDSEINYITFRDDGTLSYLPSGKEHKTNDSGEWARAGRQNGKAAKVIRKIFTRVAVKLLKDSDFELFTNLYKKTYSTEGYSITISKDIESAYNDEKEMGSCMQGNGEFFSMLEGICKIAVLKDAEGDQQGRALLWPYKETYFMDRIYATKDHLKELFLDFCKANGYYRKLYYGSRDQKQCWVDPSGAEVSVKTKVRCNQDYDYYPYLDTFHWGDGSYLYNYENDFPYAYDCTDGCRTEENTVRCDECGSRCDADDMLGDYCRECGVYDDDNDEYIRYRDAVELRNGYYTHRDNATEVEGYGWVADGELHNGDFTEVDGTWYHVDDLAYCEHNEQYYLSSVVKYIDDLNISVHVDYVDAAYEYAGWVKNEDGDWIEELEVEDEN